MSWDRLFDYPLVGKVIKRIIYKKEKGDFESLSFRRYFKRKYKVEAGLYSYGWSQQDLNYSNGGEIIIGRYCSIAKNVRYFGANHPINNAVMSPYFYNPSLGYDVRDVERHKLSIGNDVWIGYGALITSSCKSIGNGAVIAAGSIVTKDVPPYAIVAGNPAKVLKYRFDQETINLIEKTKWWDYSPDKLYKYYDFMGDPFSFSNRIVSDKMMC